MFNINFEVRSKYQGRFYITLQIFLEQQFLKAVLLLFILIKSIEKLNISENYEMRNPTLTRIIHANKLSGNDFKTWKLCNNK